VFRGALLSKSPLFSTLFENRAVYKRRETEFNSMSREYKTLYDIHFRRFKEQFGLSLVFGCVLRWPDRGDKSRSSKRTVHAHTPCL